MRQILQSVRTGEICVADVPVPQAQAGSVLVRVAASLLSVGTERASSQFAQKSIVGKARSRPDLVREVIGKARRDGILSTVEAVRDRLDQFSSPGYSCAGRVLSVGEGVTDIGVGDAVACAGAEFAVHADVVAVPRLLVAKVPHGCQVSPEEASFTTVGAVALHGIRLAEVQLGETIAVIGLGLLGQLTVQLLRAAGCRVVAMDPNRRRTELAEQFGAHRTCSNVDDFRASILEASRGRGADSVLVTAESVTDQPINVAAEVCRDRGVVVAVGTVGLSLERRLYFEKELSFRVSRSYGPGRYDANYEQKGQDYPIGYVRWTENRNMEAFLDLISEGRVETRALITHRFLIDEAQRAYDLISGRTQEHFLGIVISYGDGVEESSEPSNSLVQALAKVNAAASDLCISARESVGVGVVGAGTFARTVIVPSLKNIRGVVLAGICSSNGMRAYQVAKKFGFQHCFTDSADILNCPEINVIVIATRHHLHATQVIAAVQSGKHVFCEKPLCLTEEELAEIIGAYARRKDSNTKLMVGFNRRFAPMVSQMKDFFSMVTEPLSMQYRVNAGSLPKNHWVNDPEQGGGRILGEVCHFVDLLIYLAAAMPVRVQARALPNSGQYSGDNLSVTLTFDNGSQGIITYVANGDRSFSKERLEVYGGGKVAVLDDFRSLELVANGRRRISRSLWRQDKGHRREWEAFTSCILEDTPTPLAFSEIVASTLTTLSALRSASLGEELVVDAAGFMRGCGYSREY